MKTKITQDITALDLICHLHKGISKTKAKNIIKYSTFMVGGKAAATIPSTVFKVGQELEILRNTVTHLKHQHPDKYRPVVIKYEDEYLVVAIKPVGLLSCKNLTQQGKSFDKMLENYISKRDNRKTRLWIAHRIDREVEGLLLFAKSEEIQTVIKESWDTVTKKYLALTEGKPAPAKGTIESWLRDGFKHKVMVFNKEVEGAKFAKTEYQIVKPVGKYHLVEVTLHTGRKNQIRAHLASIGCPIVGDHTYGAEATPVRQIRLVAYSLELEHPFLKKTLKLEYQPKASFFKPSKEIDEDYKHL